MFHTYNLKLPEGKLARRDIHVNCLTRFPQVISCPKVRWRNLNKSSSWGWIKSGSKNVTTLETTNSLYGNLGVLVETRNMMITSPHIWWITMVRGVLKPSNIHSNLCFQSTPPSFSQLSPIRNHQKWMIWGSPGNPPNFFIILEISGWRP